LVLREILSLSEGVFDIICSLGSLILRGDGRHGSCCCLRIEKKLLDVFIYKGVEIEHSRFNQFSGKRQVIVAGGIVRGISHASGSCSSLSS